MVSESKKIQDLYIYEMEGAVLIQFKKQFFVSEESPENIILRVNSMEGVT